MLPIDLLCMTLAWAMPLRGRRLVCKRDVRGLDPDGCLVRRPHDRHHAPEDREAFAATSRVWGRPSGPPRENCQKVWMGELLPLDRSFLMGGFLNRFRWMASSSGCSSIGTSLDSFRMSKYRSATRPSIRGLRPYTEGPHVADAVIDA
jgi:hypothetical protein